MEGIFPRLILDSVTWSEAGIYTRHSQKSSSSHIIAFFKRQPHVAHFLAAFATLLCSRHAILIFKMYFAKQVLCYKAEQYEYHLCNLLFCVVRYVF